MKERRTAAWVLGIIALIIAFLSVILPEISYRSDQTLAFKSCVVDFNYGIKGLETDTYRVNQNRLALCLCDLYRKYPDTATANKIIQIYKSTNYDTTQIKVNYSLDSIIKHRFQLFDTLALID